MNIQAKYSYIGDWLIDKYNDEDLKKEIHRKANIELTKLLNRDKSVVDMDSYLFLSLVYIGMDRYDQSFYEHLRDYYPEAYSSFSEQHVNNRIREYVKYIRYIQEDDENRVIDYVLKESFVPRNYLPSFFRFLYDIFVIDFDYNFPKIRDDRDLIIETEKEIKNLLMQIMGQGSKSPNEELTVTVDGNYKNYILTKGTVLALSNEESLNSLAPIIVKMLNLFHADFWEDNIRNTALNKHLLDGFESWKDSNVDRRNKSNTSKSISWEVLRPRIVRYEPITGNIVLNTRRHIINGAVAGDHFQIKIYNGKVVIKTVEEYELKLKYTMGGIKIDPMQIQVDDFIGEMKYCVYHNGTEIYSTANNLFYNYLVFDKNLKILKNINEYNDNVLIASDEELFTPGFTKLPSKIHHLYTGILNDTTVLNFESSNVLLTDNAPMQIKGQTEKSVRAKMVGKTIDVYSVLHTLYVDITHEDFESLILSINEQNLRLKDISSLLEVGPTTYATLNLGAVIGATGYYKINLVNGSTNHETIELLYDFQFVNSFVFNDDYSMNQLFSSSFFENDDIRYSKEFLENDELVNQIKEVSLSHGILKYELSFDIDRYIINDKSYYLSRYIWYPNLETNFVVHTKGITSYEIIINSKESQKKLLHESQNSLIISKNDLEYALNRSNNGIIWVNIIKDNEQPITLLVHKYNIYNKGNYTLINEKDSLQIKVNYFGLNTMNLEYTDENDLNQVIFLPNNEFIKINLSPNIEFKLSIVEGEKYNPFQKNAIRRVHEELYHCHLDTNRLIKNSFTIKKAYLEEESYADALRGVILTDLHLDTNGCVRGNISHRDRDCDVLHLFDNINPVKIEFLGEVTLKGSAPETPILAHITDLDDDGLMIKKYECTLDTNLNARFGPVNHFVMTIEGGVK